METHKKAFSLIADHETQRGEYLNQELRKLHRKTGPTP
jgi:hypothetical protein